VGLIKQLKRITATRIEAFLESVEDPARVLPMLIVEMEQKVRLAANAEAKACTAVLSTQRKLDEAQGSLARLAKGIDLALKLNKDDLAREAIAEQLRVESDIESLRRSLETAEDARNAAAEACAQLKTELDYIRIRKDEIIARAIGAGSQARIGRIASGAVSSAGNILDDVARLEGRLAEAEDNASAHRYLNNPPAHLSLDARLRHLEHETELEARMAALRKKKSKTRG